MSLDELKSAVVFETENYIPLPIDQVYLDFEVIVPIKNSLDHMDILVAATSKKVVDSYVSCLKSAGLIPVALEVKSQSTLAALIKDRTSEFPVAVIDMHENTADFIVFCGHSIRFTCSIPILKPPQAKGKSSDNFITQIKKYIDFYQEHASHEHLFNPSGIKKIILCGEGSLSKGLSEFLTEKLSVQTEIGDPFINFPGARRRKINPEDFLPFATALGLAAKGVNIKCDDIDD
jgi:type IV pilus assembly protein PilM